MDKYTVYDSYCQPDRYYKVNCFDRVYNDAQEMLFIILLCSIIMIAMQVSKKTLTVLRINWTNKITLKYLIIFAGFNYILCRIAWNKYSTTKKY